MKTIKTKNTTQKTENMSNTDRKIAANELENLGDTSTLAEPAVVDELIKNRVN